ncbi:polysaccharide deacetylase [Variibacter gotjawalensis]|uniref:Chitooligosaccharide deacetylase n=2 Tax=Variibacter gotjawalensis TaxID=1333996 RepID=A0A0S3PXI4_9BRAD|nr:polysaccharide deacetylase [Variibacter gotjawalensis]BAT60464.1 polysaccharide deacetylase [Variibacter gotjawalensis]
MTPPRDMKDRAKRVVLRGVLDRLRPLAYTKITSGIRCLTFHYQFPDEQENASRLFAALKREGDFITTAELLALLDGTATRQGRLFHLSIDDGFENIATEAHPMLKSAGIPYSLMVCPTYVGAGEIGNEAFRKNAQYAAPLPLAGWDALAALAGDGVEIGAHTLSHREVSTLTTDELAQEVSQCRAEIEAKLGMPCTSFAWPFGRISAMTEEAVALAQNSGYRAIFSSVRGLLQPGQGVPRYLPRDHFEPGWPVDTVVYYATREAPLFEPPALPTTRR